MIQRIIRTVQSLKHGSQDVVQRFTSSIPQASSQALFVHGFKVRPLSSNLTFTMRLSNWPWISPSLPPRACPEYFEYLSGLACLAVWTFIGCMLCLPQQPTWQSPALIISDSLLPAQIPVILLSSTTNSDIKRDSVSLCEWSPLLN